MGDTMISKASAARFGNAGASVPDTNAIGSTGQSLEEWKRQRGIDPTRQVRVVRLVHMRYQHPDLDIICVFLQDFGMYVVKKTEDEVWLRGYGVDQYVYYCKKGPKRFLGGTFEVETHEDLVKASALEGAGPIQSLDDAPGLGFMVTAYDAEGMPVNFMYGQEPAETGKLPEKLILNYEADKPRERKFQRFEEGPAAVHKLGHYGLCVQKFQEQLDWYTRNVNFAPTDLLYVPGENGGSKEVAVFAHIDRGDELVDHHTIFLSTGQKKHVHHCSFEVHDFDTQQLGHQWLASKGYKSVWGVGRHILGSQIFDYWWDTTGNMIEHYADGDLVDQHTPIGHLPAGNESLAVWGPEVPAAFLD